MIWDWMLEALRVALFSLSHVLGGNLGLAIIVLSVAVRLALLPWSLRAARRSLALRQKLQAVQPELERIRKQHTDSRARAEAITRLYARNDIRPLRDSGLGVGLAQWPIGIALYTVIRDGIGSGARFLWIGNLARPDFLIALLTALITGLAMAIAPAHDAGPPTAMMVGITLVTLIVVIQLAAGVGLYWAASSSVGVLQSFLLRRSRNA